MAHVGARHVKVLNLSVLTALGLAYLLTGLISIINWCISLTSANQQLYSNFIPGDLGFALVALTVGVSLTTSAYYALRGDRATHLAVVACGTWLAQGALTIQVMAAAAAVLDSIVLGEEVNYSIISEYLLRMDVILGCVVLPVSVLYTLMLKKMIKRSK